MPVISPLWTAALRSHWPIVGAFGVFLLFLGVNQIWFGPTAERYDRALTRAGELGLAFDPERTSPAIPPRLFALISDNSLAAAVAQERGSSGELTAELFADLSSLASARGLEVLSTEPGPLTQQKKSVQVRAHIRLRGQYQEFVAWLNDLARIEKLVSIDRFSLSSLPDGRAFIDIWASRYILKRTRGDE